MKMHRVTMIALIVMTTHSGLGETPPDRPVARIGRRVIPYREIACTLTTSNLAELAAAQQRDPAEVCLQREQERLQLIARDELLLAAMKKRGIEPTEEELAQDASTIGYGTAEFERLAAQSRALGDALLRIHRGEDFDDVFKHSIKPLRMDEAAFRRFLTLVPTADAAESFIARHTPEHFRATIAEDARRRIGRATLARQLADEAASLGASVATHTENFWRDLVAEIGIEILDSRYRSISPKDLS